MTILIDAPRPVTPADVRRARYFGLTIPAMPAPAPEVAPANPRDSWPEWTDADRWEPGPDDDGPRPTAGPEFLPSDLDAAEWMGMALRLEGEPMAELLTNSTGMLLRFAVGQVLGLEARLEAERLERAEHDRDYRRWLDRIGVNLDPPEPRETDGFAPGYYS